jgi:hypothetical protein
MAPAQAGRYAVSFAALRPMWCLLMAACMASVSLAAAPLTSPLLISEVMYNPHGPESHDEYVELFNVSETEWIDLAGWKLGDADELDHLVDAGWGTTLAPGQFGLVLDASYFGQSTTYDSMRIEAVLLTIDDRSFGRAGWSNSAVEMVILCSPEGDTLDWIQYEPIADPGISLERVVTTVHGPGDAWANSLVIGGTPGDANSVSEPLAPTVIVEAEPDPFSDDVDIHFRLPGAPALVSMRIFDVEGRLLRSLLDGGQTGPASTVNWDGESNSGDPVPPGLYIVQLEASVQGRIAVAKKVIVRGFP